MRCIIIRKSRILTFFNIIIALIVAVSLTITVIAVEKGNEDAISPLSKIETAEKVFALAVYANLSTDTDAFLEVLGENKATFFISEEFQESFPQKVIAIAERGNTIGLLVDFKDNASKNDIYDSLAVRIERMARITGKNAELICFGNTDYDERLVQNVYSVGLLPIDCSENANEIFAGDIILAEDLQTAENLIKKAVADGFKTATVDELIKMRR